MTTSTTESTEKEAHRLALAKRAANVDRIREQLRQAKADAAARTRAEEDRRKQFDNDTKAVNARLDGLRYELTACGAALDELRRIYVSVETRRELSAADREQRAAGLLVQDAEREVRSEKAMIDSLKARVASVPSAAAPADVVAEVKRLEAAHTETLARLAKLRDLKATTDAALARVKAEYDAAMAAATRI